MEVIFTPDIFAAQAFGGISRYFAETVWRLPAAGARPLVAAGLHRNSYLRGLPGVRGFYAAKVPKRAWINARWCETLCRLHPGAVIHETFYRPQAYSHRHPTVLTVYDMIDEVWGFDGPNPAPSIALSAVKRAACARATHLIAISEATKTDLVRLFNLDPVKVTVVHLATSFGGAAQGAPRAGKSRASRASLLYVGPRAGYKNFVVLLDAYAASKPLQQNFELLCFGGPPFDAEELQKIGSLPVRWRGGYDDALLDAYRAASAYVCTSLYEGFGIPLLEAMSVGCPAFCARTSALEEVAGTAAGYFDARSSGDLRGVLEAALAQPDALAALANRGRERAKRFSWQRCAEETVAVYRGIA